MHSVGELQSEIVVRRDSQVYNAKQRPYACNYVYNSWIEKKS